MIVHALNPGTAPGEATYISDNCVPLRAPLSVPLAGTFATGLINVPGPDTTLPC
jgi:hypothetical protein